MSYVTKAILKFTTATILFGLCAAGALGAGGDGCGGAPAASPKPARESRVAAEHNGDPGFVRRFVQSGGPPCEDQSPVPPTAQTAESFVDWNSPVPSPVVQAAATSNPTVALTPATIDETFRGFVQITINGLSPGDSVRVEKFQVNNANGVIDAGAIMEQSFLLTDGTSNQINGVSNVNVPADSTPADGSIVAQIPLLDNSLPTTASEYVFQLTSPHGSFAPLMARFTVTPAAHAQDISGVITGNNAPVPHAYVVLLDTEGGDYDFVAATIADASGHYSFGAAPRQYDVVAAHRGFVGGFGKGMEQTLGANEHKTVNLPMQPGTRTISGQVRDGTTKEGLPGIQVVFRTERGKFAVDYTDASGKFSTSVTPEQWSVEVDRNAVNQIGYLAPRAKVDVNTTGSDAANVAIALVKATSLLYGTLKDESGAPLAGVQIGASDEAGQFLAYTATDSSGNYVIAIAGGVWIAAPASGALQERQNLDLRPSRFYATDGRAARLNFSANKSTTRVVGALTENTGAGVSDITYLAVERGGRFTRFGTEAGGSFSVGLSGGTWSFGPTFDSAADTDLIFVIPPDLTLADGQDMSGLSFEAQQPTRHVHVTLTDNSGAAYQRAEIVQAITVNGKTYNGGGYTDESGKAELPAFDGVWTLLGNGPELAASGFRQVIPQSITVNGSDVNVAITLEPLPPTGNTLVNLSTRGTVQTGDSVLIGGFIVPGVAPKKVLVRAIGPSLSNFGVNGALSDPTLTLFDGKGGQIGFNDNWGDSLDKQAIIDTTVPPSNNKESAIIATLPPGNYTAKVAGVGSATGVALVELYDLDSFSSSTLANIATRGRIDQGENVLIAGYIVGGYTPQQVVVRAIGPSLTQFGVPGALADPFLELRNAQGTVLISNNDWQDSQKQELIDTTLAPSNPKESALVTTLTPGNYTAVISGVGGTTGVGLAEVYNITHNF